ncbi:MAG: RES domain-containing protein, partial [Chloroflexota bacterium]|nr:RES domain-containing protein [Chloroflexota bacterium]
MKILWGFAAGRCSFPNCARMCIEAPGVVGDEHAIIGDIAHIYPHAQRGPRHEATLPEEIDLNSYDNWVLLCAVHHRLVDAQPSEHDVAFLIRAKRDHERWVADRLALGEARARRPLSSVTPLRLDDLDIYRVARMGLEPWEPVFQAGRPQVARWDDPYAEFSVLYAALSADQALFEVQARFRPDPALAAVLPEQS